MPKKILEKKLSVSLKDITKINEKVEQITTSVENINDLKNKNYLSSEFEKELKDKKEELLKNKREAKREAYKKEVKERQERIKIAVQKDRERKQILMKKEQENKPQHENKLLLKLEKIEHLEQRVKELEQRVKELEQHNTKQKSENMLTTKDINSINGNENEILISSNMSNLNKI